MTTRDRIAKGIADHDHAIEEARMNALHQILEPFVDAGDAYESAKGISMTTTDNIEKVVSMNDALRVRAESGQ